ncbi:MAG: PAS domain S-box protein [Sulfurimicrobium sp.]|nr:PAS domain S-box protein [Sulfurimicrobium sp.]MDO9188721.1 PAS domain S-box protein [Sulfurimicrobium sp.]MDP2200094.1 PAS domain S-box protein [Sulfurimicrobium sp.]MDP3688594.1 PAS domain S-box protein [Sulfurimicrobium sp.]MDZ7656885.1 PAS domain S-box protein [Sulfurimicrobium sp.]
MDIVTLQGAILDNAAYAIIATEPDGVITVFNRAAERMLGYRASELVGLCTPAILHDPDEVVVRAEVFSRELGIHLDPGFEVFVARTRLGLPNEFQWTYIRKDGSRFPVLLSVTAIYDQSGVIAGFLGIAMDVSERNAAEAAVRESAERLSEAQRIAQIGSWDLDLVSNNLIWSDEIFRIFEIDPNRFGASYEAFLNAIHPDDREKVNQAYTRSLSTREPYEIAHRLLMPDGHIKWVNERCETFYDEAGRALRSSGTVQDITVRRQAEEDLRLYASVFEHSGEAILISDSTNRILAVNPAFTLMTGYGIEEMRGKNPRLLASGHTPPQTYQKLWARLKQEGYWQGEIWDRRKDGRVCPKWMGVSAVRGCDQTVTHYIASFTDITERKAAEAHITHLAHHDVLTGLFNRFSLQNRLEQALSMVRREQRMLAVMFIDMDHFKIINDTLGHAVGDELLIEVGKRLRNSVRESDIVARLGGDEFVVVLTEMEDATTAGRVADKILRALGQDYNIGSNVLQSTPSIGLAFFPLDGEDCRTLMKHADAAMYHAKSLGRNNVQFFSAEMNRDTVDLPVPPAG